MNIISARRRYSHVLGALALLAVVACRCGQGEPAKPAEEFIDKAAKGVVFVPSLGSLSDHVQALVTSARAAVGAASVPDFSAKLAENLGFDPLNREGLKKAGFDGTRGFAAAGVGRKETVFVIPYTDLGTVDGTVTRLMKERLFLGTRKTQMVDKLNVVTYSKADGEKPLFAYTTSGRNLLLAVGDDPVALTVATATRLPATSITTEPKYNAAKKSVGARDLYVYDLVPQKPLLVKVPEGIMMGLAVGAKELAARFNVPLPAEATAKLAAALVGGETDLTKLPADQPVYLRGGLDWATMLSQNEAAAKTALAGGRDPSATNAIDSGRDFFHQVGIDFDHDIVGNLQPGFALTVGVSPTAELASAMRFDPMRSNPFNTYTFAGLGRVKDAAKAAVTLAKLAELVRKVGATVTTRNVAGSPVYTVRYSLGDTVSWTLRGNNVLVSAGYGDRLEALISSITGKGGIKPEAFPPRTRDMLFSDKGFAVAADFSKVDDAVKNAKSTGPEQPGAAFIKSMIGNAVHSVSTLRPAVQVAPVEGGVSVEVAVSIQ